MFRPKTELYGGRGQSFVLSIVTLYDTILAAPKSLLQMTTKTQAIKAFLSAMTHPDLALMYHVGMECQVNVAQDRGEKIDGEFNGVKWHGYSDGLTTWKPIRIPFGSMSEPHYVDSEMKYDIAAHADGIGMTGWNWEKKISQWVAFDFDAITGHSDTHTKKLTPEELKRVQEACFDMPWVTIRKSTSGKGLHIYVFVDNVPTMNHTEHAGLARAILNKMSGLSGYDFVSKVDIVGGNMWVWHRKMKGTDGLQLIKQGSILKDIPPNWRDHIRVVKGVSKKLSAPTDIETLPEVSGKFDILSGQRTRVKLDSVHLQLIKFLNERGLYHWFDVDHHMLVTHTLHLKQAHKELAFKGIFETETKGSTSHNVFCYPMRNGGWSVRRYGPGCKEHPSWTQDSQGWTRCYYNTEPTLSSASSTHGGIEDPSGGYQFVNGEAATKVAVALGTSISIPPKYMQRVTHIKPHKDGRLIVEFPYEQMDAPAELEGWLRKANRWIRIFAAPRLSSSELDSDNYDGLVRHIITESSEDAGWVINSGGKWNDEPLTHIRAALASTGIKKPEVDNIIGSSVMKPWTLVTRPFASEYPGDRTWNRHSPQFRYIPSVGDVLSYPTYWNILCHVGKALTDSVSRDPWCKKNGIKSGGDYLKIWIASMIQYPTEPLPYLFIYGEKQDTGKSTLHESLELLFSPGYTRVDQALQNPNGYNGELEGAILCVIEETDLNKNRTAQNRMKDWVTARKFSLRALYRNAVMITNTMHFIQTGNYRTESPPFDEADTRITMIHVADKPANQIPKRTLIQQLEKEAADFLGALISLEIPESESRLRVPVIHTADKMASARNQRNALRDFIDEKCHKYPGKAIKLSEFYDRFMAWLDPNDRMYWTSKQKVSQSMPDWVIKGRLSHDINWHWGNISFEEPTEEVLSPYVVVDNILRHEANL